MPMNRLNVGLSRQQLTLSASENKNNRGHKQPKRKSTFLSVKIVSLMCPKGSSVFLCIGETVEKYPFPRFPVSFYIIKDETLSCHGKPFPFIILWM